MEEHESGITRSYVLPVKQISLNEQEALEILRELREKEAAERKIEEGWKTIK